MKKCNRCKVEKEIEEFKNPNSKTCKKCREVSKKSYDCKKNGELPKYAQVQQLLEDAYQRGNFVCKICKIEKSLDNFGKHSNNNKYNISRVCKDCSRETNKFSKLLGYGISKDEFISKLEEQNYKCKICDSEIKYMSRYKDKYGSACVDHDHKTGKIRGLLCSSCNRALGLFKDSISITENAHKYLVQYKSGELTGKPVVKQVISSQANQE